MNLASFAKLYSPQDIEIPIVFKVRKLGHLYATEYPEQSPETDFQILNNEQWVEKVAFLSFGQLLLLLDFNLEPSIPIHQIHQLIYHMINMSNLG